MPKTAKKVTKRKVASKVTKRKVVAKVTTKSKHKLPIHKRVINFRLKAEHFAAIAVLVAVCAVVANMGAVYYSRASGTTCSVQNGLKKYPKKSGYYFLKRGSVSGYWGYNSKAFLAPPSGAANDTIVTKQMAQLVNNVGISWVSKNANKDQFTPGDSYSTGHASHNTGKEIDFYAFGNKLFQQQSWVTQKNPHKSNPNYNRDTTIALAKTLFDSSKKVRYIMYDDQKVIDAVNKYLKAKKTYGRGAGTQSMQTSSAKEHYDHFHIHLDAGSCS